MIRSIHAVTDTTEPYMKKHLYWLSSLLLAGWAAGAHAQDVWAYQVIMPNNDVRMMPKPPRDLTYPPAGVPMPIVYGNDNPGVVLTPQQAASRRNAPQLIIMLIPAGLADRTVTSNYP
jgi:hypothetical protein